MYSVEERVFIVSQYFKTKRVVAVKGNFLKKFKCGHRKKPSRSAITRLIKKFFETGSVQDNREYNVGCQGTVPTHNKVKRNSSCIPRSAPPSSIYHRSSVFLGQEYTAS